MAGFFSNWFGRNKKPTPQPQQPSPPPSRGSSIPAESKDAIFLGEAVYVGSTNVECFRYDVTKEELYVNFLNGSKYVYYHVPLDTAYEAIDWDSPGRFVWNELRDVFLYKQLEPPTRKRPKAQVIRTLR